jgi:hypothetical protein
MVVVSEGQVGKNFGRKNPPAVPGVVMGVVKELRCDVVLSLMNY